MAELAWCDDDEEPFDVAAAGPRDEFSGLAIRTLALRQHLSVLAARHPPGSPEQGVMASSLKSINSEDDSSDGVSSVTTLGPYQLEMTAAAAAAAAGCVDDALVDCIPHFSYGSNMNIAQAVSRVGNIKRRFVANLANYELVFSKKAFPSKPPVTLHGQVGYASVRPCPGAIVWGVLYFLTSRQLDEMDKHEGVGNGHYRRQWAEVKVFTAGTTVGTVIPAVMYVAEPGMEAEGLRPTDTYISALMGGRGLLPAEYMARIAAVPCIPQKALSESLF